VVTQPDKPAGRGQSFTRPPVKLLALENGIRVFQPRTLVDPGTRNWPKTSNAWIPTPGSGFLRRLIPQEVFSAPAFGCFNVHFRCFPNTGRGSDAMALIKRRDGERVTTSGSRKPSIPARMLVKKPSVYRTKMTP